MDQLEPRRILIVKTSSLGDILHTYPVISHLRKAYPLAEIDWVVERPFAPLVERHPLVSKALKIDSKRWGKTLTTSSTRKEIANFFRELRTTPYDLLLDLQGNSKSGFVTWLAKAKRKVGFGRQTVAEWPNLLATNQRFNHPTGLNRREDYLYLAEQATQRVFPQGSEQVTLKITSEEKALVDAVLATAPLKQPFQIWRALFRKTPPLQKRVVVCPGSMWPNKQLDKQTLIHFLQLLNQETPCHFFLIWGSPDEKAWVEEIHETQEASTVVEKMPLPALQNLMSRCDLVLSCDSLPLHLAGTTSTPTFSFFGASSATKYRPLGDQHRAIQGTCPYNRSFDTRCPILRSCKTGACIKSLSAEDLMQAFRGSKVLR